MGEILNYDNSNESYRAVLSHSTVYAVPTVEFVDEILHLDADRSK